MMGLSVKSRRKAVSIAVMLSFWQLFSLHVARESLLPSPASVGQALVRILTHEGFLINVSSTLIRFGTGFLAAFCLALVLGVLAGRYETVYDYLAPAAQLLQALPMVAIILLVMVWLRSAYTPVVVCILMVFPILYVNVVEGVRAVDDSLLQMARSYCLTKKQMLKHLYLPALLQRLGAGIIAATGVGLKMVIAAEVFTFPEHGMGARLQSARMAISIPDLFAWALIVILISAAIDSTWRILLVKPVMNRLK